MPIKKIVDVFIRQRVLLYERLSLKSFWVDTCLVKGVYEKSSILCFLLLCA